ncbi:MAG: tetratricopeptide repeat protein [Chloroflexota bacterium]
MIELLLDAESQLALGLLDQAERTYRTVLEADPRNGIAAVGLSRVALERGDETGALALAQAAREIDPENATARRMIDRLEEVARFRNAAAASPALQAAATPPADPPADDSAAMIRASGIVRGAPDDSSAARATGAEEESARHEHVESSPRGVESAAGTVAAPPTATPAAPTDAPTARGAAEHESSTHSQQLGGVATVTAPPSAAAHQAAPARPGLLRRILRRS